MKTSRYAYLISAGLIVLLVLAFLNPGLVSAYLIGPLARILWFIYRSLAVIDQLVYWVLLVLVVFIVSLYVIPTQKEQLEPPSNKVEGKMDDRVMYWEKLLNWAEEDANARLMLQRELEYLNRSVDSLTVGNGDDQPAIQLPPWKASIQARFLALGRRPFLSRILPKDQSRSNTELESSIDIILKSLETKMETSHDRSISRTYDD